MLFTGVVAWDAVAVGVTAAGGNLHGHVVAALVAADVQAVRVPACECNVFQRQQSSGSGRYQMQVISLGSRMRMAYWPGGIASAQSRCTAEILRHVQCDASTARLLCLSTEPHRIKRDVCVVVVPALTCL
jgi:hypothetical protein